MSESKCLARCLGIPLKVLRHKSQVSHAVKTTLADPDYVFDLSFGVKIERRSGQESSETRFVVHHTICGDSMDSQMRQWTRDQNLVPWVAVAAQLPVNAFLRKSSQSQG
jgi:sacsin